MNTSTAPDIAPMRRPASSLFATVPDMIVPFGAGLSAGRADVERLGNKGARLVEMAALGTQDVSATIAALAHTAESAGSTALGVQDAARGLSGQTRALAAELANFTVSRSTFDALSNAEADLYRDERDEAMAIADYHKMRAELETLTGQEVAREAP